jgi:hypothetical protein
MFDYVQFIPFQPLWWACFPVAFPTSFLCIVVTEQDWVVGTLWVHIYWLKWIYLCLSMCVLIMTNLDIHFVSIPQGTNILQTAPLPFVGGSSMLLWYSNATVKLSMGMSSNRINWSIQTGYSLVRQDERAMLVKPEPRPVGYWGQRK